MSTIPSNPMWYKDAIIYEVPIKSFYDSNGDGYGDIVGLISKLDYIQDLGVNCIWILPFYPSPLKDDGYDISDYHGINPRYGNIRDFKQLVKACHKRGIRIISELVVNHTSDQHPWFQAARRAPKGSAKRNYYVWSETPDKFKDARIIFTDTETSNWTWDPVAEEYYWHRFFSHQPDLNYDNPHVIAAINKTMRYWLDMGVDGLRLDAIPYLIERDGTNCENLAETHDILRGWRKIIDDNYSDKMLLAEANQWPSDVRAYFGDGDECHMAYHFPVMPRIFMALHQGNAYPVIDIIKQTPDIPENCQWAMFLRNHDELTLEMVTDDERDYMYNAYAAHPLMRLNIGIRRRLAPLLENSRRRFEIMFALLFSLHGTPIIYYGDEIGMGDNLHMGDRNGVRTPMQWSADRNAGFSRAPSQELYSLPVLDSVYSYLAVNVEDQTTDASSRLNWLKKLIYIRNQFKAFGWGSLTFVENSNPSILSFVRSYQNKKILCVFNLASESQPVYLNLKDWNGLTPIELWGCTSFPKIEKNEYFLSLSGHVFYWFDLV